MAEKTITREEFQEGVEVCRRILRQANAGMVSKATEEVTAYNVSLKPTITSSSFLPTVAAD